VCVKLRVRERETERAEGETSVVTSETSSRCTHTAAVQQHQQETPKSARRAVPTCGLDDETFCKK
jgi:hypothetical protein